MPKEFIIPESITLAGVKITVRFDTITEDMDVLGFWSNAKHEIVINPNVPKDVQFRAFTHELSEAISYLFVNSPETGSKVPHETVDGYGMGILNFLVENAHLVIKDNSTA